MIEPQSRGIGSEGLMRRFILLSAGALLGSAASYALMSGYQALDDGISYTYRCDQLAREDDARTSAEKIIQHFLEGKSLADLKSVADAAGLQIEQFDKGNHTEIWIGHSPETAALNFDVVANRHISVLPLPGGPPCNHFDEDQSE